MRSIKRSFSVIAMMTITVLCAVGFLAVRPSFAGAGYNGTQIYVSEGYIYYQNHPEEEKQVDGISYDAENRILTLNNYSGDFLEIVVSYGGAAAGTPIAKITLNILGENHLGHIGVGYADLIITGNGKLWINESRTNKNAILLKSSLGFGGSKLTVNSSVDLKAYSSGSENPVFIIKDSTQNDNLISINNSIDSIKTNAYNPPKRSNGSVRLLQPETIKVYPATLGESSDKYYVSSTTEDGEVYEQIVAAGLKGLEYSIVRSCIFSIDSFDIDYNAPEYVYLIDEYLSSGYCYKNNDSEKMYLVDSFFHNSLEKYQVFEIVADFTQGESEAGTRGIYVLPVGEYDEMPLEFIAEQDTSIELYNVYLNTDYYDNKAGGENDPENITRIYGAGRYDTAISAADQLLKAKGIDKHENIIVASGENFPDALAGGYLAEVKNAPILLITQAEEQRIANEIFNKLQPGGTVYLLGGTNAVSENFETYLKENGIKTQRLGGAGRYETNMLILKAAGVQNEDLLICTGAGFADSLSASAAGKPIFLVGDSLTDAQQRYLQSLHPGNIYLIGGTAVVSDNIKSEISAITGKTGIRIAGDNRYATSVEVAKAFCNNPEVVTLVYALNFPDGLSGSPLAMALNAPILLVTDQQYASAMQYSKSNGVTNALVLSGPSLIPDSVARQFVQ